MAELQFADILRPAETDPTLQESEPVKKPSIVRKKYKFIIRDLFSETGSDSKDYDAFNVIEVTGTHNEVVKKIYHTYFSDDIEEMSDKDIFEMIDNSEVFCKNVEASNKMKKNIWVLASLYDFFKMIYTSKASEVEPEMILNIEDLLDSYEEGAKPEEEYDINDCKDVMKGE